ncbi:MAG: GntR family transcriptional regulator [Planctomycetes bacterium]|nr:GntR family transcriptional regulator [Planctomycetota bacterium]
MPLAEVEHGSRRARVAASLLADVFGGRRPAGERLKVGPLARKLGVSATPVREALVELAGAGVVELLPRRGAVILPFGPRQLREICHLRRVLEAEAARCACGRIAPVELQELAAALSRQIRSPRDARWSAETRRLDSRLHELIAARCGNERLASELGRYRILYRTLRDLHHQRRTARSNFSRMEENAEHLAVVEALAKGDADGAAAAMGRHLESAAFVLERELFGKAAVVTSG